MENPQAQMQGQGQPQQQGQDQQMQQVMQAVQQMVQQGMQPVEIAAQLLQQLPPEAIMQVFVQMGIPEQEAQATIQEAMQGAQAQQQGAGEEQIEGAASNPAEESAEIPAEGQQMKFGGMPKRLVKRKNGGGNPEQEMQAVMGQVQEMMQGGADARQVMEQIQAAVQQGQISPEVAQAVMQQLSGQMEAVDPQLEQPGANPQTVDPNMASPDSQMMAFGGNLKKLMSKAFGGDLTVPSIDSKTYAQDRAALITNAIKNNTFKSTLDSDFPSLMGNQMAYGGDLPKADNGFDIGKYKTKDEAELAAYRYRQGLSADEQAKFNIDETLKGWKEPEPTYEAGKSYQYDPATKKFNIIQPPAPTYEAGKNYQYDPATKGFKAVDTPANTGQVVNGVGYPNPFGGGLYNNLYYGTSPMARFMANSTMYGVPKVKGTNLPGGMDATAFMMQTAGQNLAPGMSGKANGQDYRITGVEDIKGGLFGRKKVGVRYNIDWGNPASVAAAQQGTPAGPGLSGFNADANGDNIPDYLGASTTTMNGANLPAGPQNNPAGPVDVTSNQGTPVTGITPSNNLMWDSGNMPSLQNPMNAAPKESPMELMPMNTPNRVDTNLPAGLTGIPEFNQRQEISKFQQGQAAKGLVWNAPTNSWVSKEALDISAQMNAPATQSGSSMGVEGPAFATQQDLMNIVNNPTPQFNDTPRRWFRDRDKVNALKQTIGQDYVPARARLDQGFEPLNGRVNNADANFWDSEDINSSFDANGNPRVQVMGADGNPINNANLPQYRAFGGGVDAQALNNAVALINKAFGGSIPMATNGMQMQSSLDVTTKNKFNPDWNAVGDMYMGAGNRLVNFMDGVNAINPERDIARMSALNTQPIEFSQMKQGIYDQAGNFIPNDIGNQVLNPTDIYASQERQVFAYGGKVYELGGDVELDDNELAQLQQAGFKVSKI
jgi:hypothetical protein